MTKKKKKTLNCGYPVNDGPAGDDSSKTAQLVELARGGDRTAFHHLADRYQHDIYRMIYYRTRSELDAEDLTQDVFLKAFSNLKQLKSAEVFKSWLFRIAVNRVRDFYRRKTVKSVFGFVSLDDPDFQETEEIAVSPEAPSHMERRAFWKKINQMLRILPRMEKEVFLLRFFDDLSIREISSILGKNESTVKTHLYRALSKIKSTSAGMEELLEGQ